MLMIAIKRRWQLDATLMNYGAEFALTIPFAKANLK